MDDIDYALLEAEHPLQQVRDAIDTLDEMSRATHDELLIGRLTHLIALLQCLRADLEEAFPDKLGNF